MPKFLWIERLPLRVRLTLWYVLLLALTLGLFSTYLYFHLENSLLAQVDTTLQVAGSQALANLDNEDGRLAFQNMELTQTAVRRLSQPGFAIRLIGQDGTVWETIGQYPITVAPRPLAAGYATLTENEAIWRIYSQPVQQSAGRIDSWVQVAQSLQPTQETLKNLRWQIELSWLLALLLAGGGGLLLADRALRPIDRITRTAQSVGVSDLSQRIDYQGAADEVGRLATTFDRMVDRLQAAFVRERRFTIDASHELRTPLTILKGRIDVTLSQPRANEVYQTVLQDLGKNADRLIRLSADLLFLARFDQGQPHRQPERLNLSELLAAIVEQVRPLADAKNLSLTQQVPPHLFIQGEPDHLIRLFLNLLDNAIKYTPPGGLVSLLVKKQIERINVMVSDTGVGISVEHLPHLFEPFYRVEAARTRSQGGAGLGLAIAYEIAHAHGGDLCVQSEPDQGTTFIVHLPS